MSLKNYSREELENKPMIELATMVLHESGKAEDFRDTFAKVAELKGFNKEQKQNNLAQFYTDLTMDGRFITTGSGVWGLKRWYPVEQIDEEVTAAPKKKKKKPKKKKKEEEAPLESEDEELDIVDDDIEVLTGTFEDEKLDDDEEDYDDEFDTDYDDDEENTEDETDEENDEEENK